MVRSGPPTAVAKPFVTGLDAPVKVNAPLFPKTPSGVPCEFYSKRSPGRLDWVGKVIGFGSKGLDIVNKVLKGHASAGLS